MLVAFAPGEGGGEEKRDNSCDHRVTCLVFLVGCSAAVGTDEPSALGFVFGGPPPNQPGKVFFPYIALISAFASQMALLGFIFPLFISPETCHLMVEDYSRACQREREVRRKKKKKKAQKKPLHCDQDLNPRTLTPELSVLSIRPWRPAQIFTT